MNARLEQLQRSARSERFRAWAPRIAFWAVVAILAIGGLKQIVSPASGAPARQATAGLVDKSAEELAQRFTRTYLTYDATRPEARDRALAQMVPADFDVGAGLLPAGGRQRVIDTQIAQHQEALAGGSIVVVAALIAGEKEPVYLGVPIDRRPSGGLYINAYPSLVGPPALGQASLPLRESVEDEAIAKVVDRVLDNYLSASTQNLAADLAEGAEVSPPTQRLRLVSVDDLVWAQGPDVGAVLATVAARDREGSLWTLSYELGIEQSEVDGRTTVTFIETLPSES